MSVPDGVFIIVVKCRDCGAELNRSNPLTRKDYTMAVILCPIMTSCCLNGCRPSASDWNANTIDEWQREDGTVINQAIYQRGA
jgi:hypothetical protein